MYALFVGDAAFYEFIYDLEHTVVRYGSYYIVCTVCFFFQSPDQFVSAVSPQPFSKGSDGKQPLPVNFIPFMLQPFRIKLKDIYA